MKLLLTAEASDAIRKGSTRTHIKSWMKDKAPHGETHGRLSISLSKLKGPQPLLLKSAPLRISSSHLCYRFWNKSMFLISTHLSKQLSLANKNVKHRINTSWAWQYTNYYSQFSFTFHKNPEIDTINNPVFRWENWDSKWLNNSPKITASEWQRQPLNLGSLTSKLRFLSLKLFGQ